MKKNKLSPWRRFKNFWLRSYYETKLGFKSETPRQMIKNLLWMVAGNVVLAFGTAVFIIPNSLVTGGVSGLGIIISGALAAGGVNLDVELIITLLTWLLFFVGMLLLGLRFSFKTLIATAIYPPLLYLFQMMLNATDLFNLSNDLLAALFGGIFVGVGCGFTFLGGGSTGGVDCLSLAANKYLRVKTSLASFLIDGSIILVGFIFQRDLESCLIGIISAIMAAMMIDRVFLGQSTSFIAWIVTDRYDELSRRINDELSRGTTLFVAEGGYTSNATKVVEVVFDRKEYRDIQNIIVDVDPKAFVTTMRAHEVNGYGFKSMPKKKLTLDEMISRDRKTKRRSEAPSVKEKEEPADGE